MCTTQNVFINLIFSKFKISLWTKHHSSPPPQILKIKYFPLHLILKHTNIKQAPPRQPFNNTQKAFNLWGVGIAPLIFAIPVLALATQDDFGGLGPIPSKAAGYLIFTTTFGTNLFFGVDRLYYQKSITPTLRNCLRNDPRCNLCSRPPTSHCSIVGLIIKNINVVFQVINLLSLIRCAAIYGQVIPPNSIRLFYQNALTQWIGKYLYKIFLSQGTSNEQLDLQTELIGLERHLQKQLRQLNLERNIYQEQDKIYPKEQALKTLLSSLGSLNDITRSTLPADTYLTSLRNTSELLKSTMDIKNNEQLFKIVFHYMHSYESIPNTIDLQHSSISYLLSWAPALIFAACTPSVLFVTITESLEAETLSEQAKEFLFFCIGIPVGIMGIDTLNQFYHTASKMLLSMPQNTLHSLFYHFIGKPALSLALTAITTIGVSKFGHQPLMTSTMITAAMVFAITLALNLYQEPTRLTRPMFWAKVLTTVLVLGSWGGLAAVYNDVFDSNSDLKWESFWDTVSNIVPALSEITGVNGLSQIILYLGVCIFNSYGAIFGLWKQLDAHEKQQHNNLNSNDSDVIETNTITLNETVSDEVDEAQELQGDYAAFQTKDTIKTAIDLSKTREETVRYHGQTLHSYWPVVNPEASIITSAAWVLQKGYSLWHSSPGAKARNSDSDGDEAPLKHQPNQ